MDSHIFDTIPSTDVTHSDGDVWNMLHSFEQLIKDKKPSEQLFLVKYFRKVYNKTYFDNSVWAKQSTTVDTVFRCRRVT
jgi:hypothetical protein